VAAWAAPFSTRVWFSRSAPSTNATSHGGSPCRGVVLGVGAAMGSLLGSLAAGGAASSSANHVLAYRPGIPDTSAGIESGMARSAHPRFSPRNPRFSVHFPYSSSSFSSSSSSSSSSF
jgi:hypothetical protein